MNEHSVKQVLFVKEGRDMYGAELATYRLLTHLDQTLISPTLLVLEYSPKPSQFLSAMVDENITVEVAYSVSDLGKKLGRLAPNSDAIVSVGYKSHILCWWFARKFEVSRFAICHGWVATDIKLKIYNVVARWCLKRCKAVMTVSKTIRTGNEQTHVIYNGVDRKQLERASQEPVPYLDDLLPKDIVAYVGRLEKEKGVVELLEAWQMLDHDAQLVIAGDGALRRELEKKAGAMAKPITFLGHVENPAPLIKRAACLVLPSHTEALPLVILEAMALGTPVLATPVGEIPDILTDGENGFLLSGRLPRQIVAGIEQVLSKSNMEGILDTARRNVDEKFSQEAVAKRVQDVIMDGQ